MVAFHRYITSPGSNQALSQVNATATSTLRAPRPRRGMAFLPRRTAADGFVYSFFEYYQPVYPVLYRRDFQSRYERLWMSAAEDSAGEGETQENEAAFAATLNLVFAIGSRSSPFADISQKVSVPDDFYPGRESYFRMIFLRLARSRFFRWSWDGTIPASHTELR